MFMRCSIGRHNNKTGNFFKDDPQVRISNVSETIQQNVADCKVFANICNK